MQSSADFEHLIKLIKNVKPSLGNMEVKSDQSLVDDLGLDSLDLLQLSRKIHRSMGVNFDLEKWDKDQDVHNRSVESILVAIAASASSE